MKANQPFLLTLPFFPIALRDWYFHHRAVLLHFTLRPLHLAEGHVHRDLREDHYQPWDGPAAPRYVVVVAWNEGLDAGYDELAAEYVALDAGYFVISVRYFGTDLRYFKDALRDESNDLWNGSKPYKD